MDNLHFQNEELGPDLVGKGRIYNIGFEQGLNKWSEFLKTGGYIAVSEASWFTEKRPAEIDEFWQACLSRDRHHSKTRLTRCKKPVIFPLQPLSCRKTAGQTLHAPQVRAQEAFLKKHAGSETAEEFIAFERHETQLYYRYNEYYGYVFYIGKKI